MKNLIFPLLLQCILFFDNCVCFVLFLMINTSRTCLDYYIWVREELSRLLFCLILIRFNIHKSVTIIWCQWVTNSVSSSLSSNKIYYLLVMFTIFPFYDLNQILTKVIIFVIISLLYLFTFLSFHILDQTTFQREGNIKMKGRRGD